MRTLPPPAGGVIAAFLGLQNDSTLIVEGEGDWQKWDGNFQATSGGQRLAELELTGRDGLFGYDGNIAASLFPAGLARNIAGPRLGVNGTATVDNGLVGLDAQIRSAAATIAAQGGFNIRASLFDAMRLDMRVRNPSALSPSLRAQDLQLRILLNGRVSELRYQYLLTAPQLAFDKSLLTGVRVEGAGKRDPGGWDFPVEFRSGTLVGNGDLLQRLGSDLSGEAFLRLDGARLFASDIGLTTRSVTAVADFEAQLDSGALAVGLSARAPGFLLRGVGIADLAADLTIGSDGGGVVLGGDVTARMRRMDNGFLRGLAGGLPVLETGLGLGPDNRLRFSNLKIDAPELQFQGQGAQLAAAEFSFSGQGSHSQYGVFDLELDGRLERPQIALLLDSPLPAAGLSQVRLDLEPADSGFAFTAAGGSTLGPFDGDGRIVLVAGEQTVVRINRLLVSDTVASGNIRPTSLGLAGNMDVTGGGVEGTVMFEPGTTADAGNRQLIRAELEASNARFDGEPPILIRTGSLDADILLVEGQSDIVATVQAQGISRGEVMIGRIAGNVKLTNGTGQATFSVAGTRGSSFDFQARADITPDRYMMTGNGVFEDRSLRFARPLDLRRSGDGWVASPTVLRYGTGTARLSGKWGNDNSRLNLQLTRLPLSLLDIAYDDLELGGEVSGSIKLTQSGSRLPGRGCQSEDSEPDPVRSDPHIHSG